MFERTLRVIITDLVFWLVIELVAALAGCAHYLMKHYHLCADGWKRTGRYIIGILIFANGFAGWFAAHPNATACEVVITMALLIMATGLATFVAYGIDNTVDRERRGQDLRERGTPVEG